MVETCYGREEDKSSLWNCLRGAITHPASLGSLGVADLILPVFSSMVDAGKELKSAHHEMYRVLFYVPRGGGGLSRQIFAGLFQRRCEGLSQM